MEGNMFKKALVVGIIFLFIGVGIQPAFAKNTIKTTISETLEDCECQPISNHNLDRLEKLSIRTNTLLNRVKIFTNIAAILSKINPEISKEKFVELSNRITILKEITEKSNLNYPQICTALDLMILSLYAMTLFFQELSYAFELAGFEGLSDIYYQMSLMFYPIIVELSYYWDELGCDEYWP